MRWMIVMGLVACATEQKYTPKPVSEIVAARLAHEVPGTCERLSPQQALVAAIDHELVEKLGPKVIAWAQEHPEQARMIAKAIERKAKEAVARLREQLGRAERTFAQRCTGALAAAAIARAAGSGTAVLEGRLLMPAGALPLAGAKVELAAAGTIVATVTASACGRFRFERVPAGTYTLAFATRTFGGSYEVTLGATTVASDFRVQPAPIAVIRGHYDAVEVILAELGIPFERLSPGCLASPELASYRLVLVNCRSPEVLHPTTLANMRAFVAGGGSMYFSDLTLPNIEQAWPELLEPARATGVSETRPARVVDAELRSFLGDREQVELRFNLSGWRRPTEVGRDARVLLADAERRHPYMVLVPAARGLVGYTSFHYSAQPLDDMVTSLVYFVTRL